MNTTEQLARFVVETRLEDIPAPAIARTKELFVDMIGVAVAGSVMPVTTVLSRLCREKRCRGEATVIGLGYRTSTEDAALINATALHETELEAVPMKGLQLTAMPAFAALAVAEKFGLSGKDLLEGFILGLDVYGRISLYTPGISARGGWGGETGIIGAATAVGKMLKLNVHQMRMAIGLAASQASGLIEQGGTNDHVIEMGIPAGLGLRAALWAQAGLTSMPDVLEHEKCFCDFYAGEGGYNLEKMTANLGKTFIVTEPGVFVKKYPCCFRTHRALDATFELIAENRIKSNDVAEIEVGLNAYDRSLLKYPEPSIGFEGRFSMQHCLAAALFDGKVDESTFSDAKVRALKQARTKINVVFHKEWPPTRDLSRTPVTIKLKNGKQFSREVNEPRNPSMDYVIDRFKTSASGILPDEAIEKAVNKIVNLEKTKKISEIMNLVRGKAKS